MNRMQMPHGDNEEWWTRFQALLDEQNDWPVQYTFKFIVPRDGSDDLQQVFGDEPVVVRASSKGNYVSVTATMGMASSDEVIRVYRAAAEVDGVISL